MFPISCKFTAAPTAYCCTYEPVSMSRILISQCLLVFLAIICNGGVFQSHGYGKTDEEAVGALVAEVGVPVGIEVGILVGAAELYASLGSAYW